MRCESEEIFELLYDRYYEGLYRYIYSIVRDKWNTEDIISTVFTKLYINRDKIQDVECSKNWVYKIAHNTIMDYYRKNSKVIPIDKLLENGKLEEAYDDIIIKEEFNAVKTIIEEEFSDEVINLINLRYYGGLKFREIAEITNISENTIKSIISRSVKRVRKIYDSLIIKESSEKRKN